MMRLKFIVLTLLMLALYENSLAQKIKPVCPTRYVLSGGGTICSNDPGLRLTLSASDLNVSYQLLRDGLAVEDVLMGTGGELYWSNQNVAGNYTVSATHTVSNCTQAMRGRARIIVDAVPLIYDVTGGVVCTGTVTVGLSGSESRVTYQLQRNGTNDGAPIKGTGGPISFGAKSVSGVYTVIATNASNCSLPMTGRASLNQVPDVFTVAGGGSYCAGGSGVTVSLSGSQAGVDYQLLIDGNPSGASVPGTGSQLNWTLQTIQGNYTVLATGVGGCTQPMTSSATVGLYLQPSVYTLSGGGEYCRGGSGVSVTLSGSQTEVKYQLLVNGIAQGDPVAGTGGGLTWTQQTLVGNYTVTAFSVVGNCSQPMSGSTNVALYAQPLVYNLTGGGNYCAGGTGVGITLGGSQTGVKYQLKMGASSVGEPLVGTGSALTWSDLKDLGTYSVVAIADNGGCTETMTGNPVIGLYPQPTVYNLSGGGNFCQNGSGVSITLSGSQTNVNYQLQVNGGAVGLPMPGTGAALIWTEQKTAGVYTVLATSNAGNCAQPMNGNATANAYPQPVAFSVGGGGNYCSGSPGVSVTLGGSETGVRYQLLIAGAPSGAPIDGTGSALSWNNQTTVGTYTVLATNISNGCSSSMTGNASIGIYPQPQVFTVGGGGSTCGGTAGVAVTLSSSQTNVNYQLKLNGANSGSPLAGTGSKLTFSGNQNAGTYTIDAISVDGGCVQPMTGNALITSTPVQFAVSGGGELCEGSQGIFVNLNGSQIGISYQLKVDGVNEGSPLAGTGNGLAFSNNTKAGTYSIVAKSDAGSCTAVMTGTAQIKVNPLPLVFTLSGGGNYFDGGLGVPVKLSGSQTGVNYQLRVGNDNTGEILAGTGDALTWMDQAKTGVYSAVATTVAGSCSRVMNGSAIVDLLNLEIPDAVKVSRTGKMPAPPYERQMLMRTLEVQDTIEVFEAPPCLEGQYYAGFQLLYDLGDKNTQVDWTGYLELTLLHGDDSVWTKPLQVNMKEQTFIGTIFHDLVISCNDDYRVVITRKTILGSAPQDNIYLKFLLYRYDEALFNPNDVLTISCPYASGKTTIGLNYTGKVAKAYDLEWVFIADHEGFTGTSAEEAFRFTQPVRVTLVQPYYKHQIYYPNGKLWYRARAVGYNPENPEHRIQGKWYYNDCSVITIANPQADMNWQQQTVFAEDGKYKKVVQYYDGTLRQRQVQTNLSTEQTTLVGETFYDFEGRMSADVLAVPVNSESLAYRDNFNQFQSANATVTANTSAAKKKFHYDNSRIENSIISNVSGAGNYYSSANTLASIHRDYIADGKGYVYSQTEYTNDGTGRVARQSGVGEAFKIDGAHPTKYFYGNVAPEEIARLFGTNAGSAEHYKKNAVVDPNGQVSVTYLDQEGRTIATALAGTSPSNVDALPSYTALNTSPTTVDISRNNAKSNGLSRTTHKILNTSAGTNYQFRYDLSALGSQVENFGCQSCTFDLKIEITDPDGRVVSLGGITGNQAPNTFSYQRKGISAADCTNPLVVGPVQFSVVLLEVGDYTITKTLTGSELSFQQMQSVVSQNAEVQRGIEEIAETVLVDPEDCEICRDENAAAECPEAAALINEAIEEIAALDCDNLYQQIIADLKATQPENPEYEPTDTEIKGHAKYCQYELCAKDKDSDAFEKQLARVNGWNAAVAAGYDNVINIDPFFTGTLSGANYKSAMQAKINNVSLGMIAYDNNRDGVKDGERELKGTLAVVTNPASTAYYVDAYGNPAPTTGKHILYYDLMSRRSELGETQYQEQLDNQRWVMFKAFYTEAKRKTKLEIPAYANCASAKAELQRTGMEGLPTTEQGIYDWGVANGALAPVSEEELDAIVLDLQQRCGNFDKEIIRENLRQYFNSNPKNISRLLILEDYNNNNINLRTIAGHMPACTFTNFLVSNPAACLKTRTVYLPDGSVQGLMEGGRMASSSMFAQPSNLDVEMTKQKRSELLSAKTSDNDKEKREKDLKYLSDLELKAKQDKAMKVQAEIKRLSDLSVSKSKANKNSPSSATFAALATAPPTQAEYNALLALYNATGGPSWTNNTGWSSAVAGTPVSVSGWYGVTTDFEGHVTELRLADNKLIGTLPTALGNLTYLRILVLGNSATTVNSNSFTGQLPSTLVNLTNLIAIDVSATELVGVPSFLKDIPNLTQFDFAGNGLTGNFPGVFYKMPKLQYLDLSWNQLTGSLSDSIKYLPNLASLDLYLNKNLTGPLPASIGTLSKLWFLNISQTNFTGAIPSEIGNMTSMSQFWCITSGFSGQIPASVGNLTNLRDLYISYTNVSGQIPSTITNLANLRQLNLYHNQLTGPIPSDINRMTSLETFLVFENQLSGTIPASLSNMPNLQLIWWYSNQLTGTIPDLTNLVNLRDIRLNDNKLTGPLPASITASPKLQLLDLTNNQITGPIPSTLWNTNFLSNLAVELRNNRLEGAWPSNISPKVNRLYFDKNKFTFTDFIGMAPNYKGPNGYVLFAPQDSVDVDKVNQAVAGAPFSLVANVDRNAPVACEYQWFKYVSKYVNGTWQPDVALNQRSTSGHTYTFTNPQEADEGRYYYKIYNTFGGFLGAITSKRQSLDVITGTPYTYCEELDATKHPMYYAPNWAQEVATCMARAAEEREFIIQYATEKYIEEQVTDFYNTFKTNCLERVTERLNYTYVSKEYHYTLYYFDHAGSLLQTVPPQGVNLANPNNHNLISRYRYNSLNQLVWQKTPDAGVSNFWYNEKGQLRLSQNAQQALDQKYSYTKYDEQGRVIEVGEMGAADQAAVLAQVENVAFPKADVYPLNDVTITHYDFGNKKINASFAQKNLRTRVAWVEVTALGYSDTVATYYTYDIHGNVKSLLQQIPGLDNKRIDYAYDLVSGKVNFVMYQYGEKDQFIHRYSYDADNRITDVQTSSDGFIWNRDAGYQYYAHGPLARTELGEYRVQGQDYMYTLQGWVKGVNMPYSGDPGKDNVNGSMVGKDVYAYALGYYEGDYAPINNTLVLTDTRDKLWTRAQENIAHKGLFNGNISWMVTDLAKIGEINNDRTKGMQAMVYKYDQLHRITKSRSLTSYTAANGFAARGANAAYDENFSYDANGNILTLQRKDDKAVLEDDFAYNYYANTNKLRQHKASGGLYEYDAIGNLVKDGGEGTVISWTPYGKVRQVVKGDSVTVMYRYDASGNRIEKKVIKAAVVITSYLRDASGNVMSIYKDNDLKEQTIFGSSRVAQFKGRIRQGYRTLGGRNFELANHLGNILSVVTDNIKIETSTVSAIVITTNDYYSFGSEEKGRSWNGDEQYRYGFNGKEKDGDLGDVAYDYGFRIYNPTIAKFLSVDPLTKDYPWYTPYQFAGNSPIEAIDLDGLEEVSNKIINDVRFVELKNVTFKMVIRQSTETLTTAMSKSVDPKLDNYSVNTQMGEPVPGTEPEYEDAETPQPNYRSQGFNIVNGKTVGGRSSSETWHMSVSASGGVTAGKGNPGQNSYFAVGGATPLYVNGLKYGETNVWKPNTPKEIDRILKGAVAPENQKWLLQKSNGVYADQNSIFKGKTVLGYNSANKHWMIVSQENLFLGGMTYDAIRDQLIQQGFDLILGYDGSDSAILLKNGLESYTAPAEYKNNTMPSGMTLSVPKLGAGKKK